MAIGRNEGERLGLCLSSANSQVNNVIYVDSGSTDNSRALALALGAQVIELDLTQPFTAARARNAGFAKLKQILPGVQFVQFVDGDCEIQPGWINNASRFLKAHPHVAVVCGRRRERNATATVFNHLCDIEWDTPVGDTNSCGGDAMIRVAAFEQLGGYDSSLIAGEEPDLCWRMRRCGWTIHRLDAEMTVHDAAMTRFSQWWARNQRSGYASAEAFFRQGGLQNSSGLRKLVSNAIWSLPPAWPFWPLLWWRVYSRHRDCAYATFVVLGKLPHLQGQLRYFFDRALGKKARLIEYK